MRPYGKSPVAGIDEKISTVIRVAKIARYRCKFYVGLINAALSEPPDPP
jgi:hypothetical protein